MIKVEFLDSEMMSSAFRCLNKIGWSRDNI